VNRKSHDALLSKNDRVKGFKDTRITINLDFGMGIADLKSKSQIQNYLNPGTLGPSNPFLYPFKYSRIQYFD
jgi:hypothetical protein